MPPLHPSHYAHCCSLKGSSYVWRHTGHVHASVSLPPASSTGCAAAAPAMPSGVRGPTAAPSDGRDDGGGGDDDEGCC